MTYGLAVYNSIGVEILSNEGNCPRIVSEFIVNAGSGGTYDFTGLVEGTLYAVAIPETAYSGTFPNPHTVTVSGYVVTVSYDTVTYFAPFAGAGKLTDSRIIVFTK